MKKLLMLMLMLLCGVASAATTKNPDRYTSVGIDYQKNSDTQTFGAGELFDPKDQSITWASPEGKIVTQRVTLDLRVPISDFVTFNVHGGPSQMESFGAGHTGYSVGAGVRVYLPSLTN